MLTRGIILVSLLPYQPTSKGILGRGLGMWLRVHYFLRTLCSYLGMFILHPSRHNTVAYEDVLIKGAPLKNGVRTEYKVQGVAEHRMQGREMLATLVVSW